MIEELQTLLPNTLKTIKLRFSTTPEFIIRSFDLAAVKAEESTEPRVITVAHSLIRTMRCVLLGWQRTSSKPTV
jgi:hypothetical protein